MLVHQRAANRCIAERAPCILPLDMVMTLLFDDEFFLQMRFF